MARIIKMPLILPYGRSKALWNAVELPWSDQFPFRDMKKCCISNGPCSRQVFLHGHYIVQNNPDYLARAGT